MFRTLFAFFCLALIWGFGSGCASETAQAPKDSLALISDAFLGDETDPNLATPPQEEETGYVIEPYVPPTNFNPNAPSTVYEAPSSGPAETQYQASPRSGDSPDDFAQAIIVPAIRLCFADPFGQAQHQVLKADDQGPTWLIQVQITWQDRWSKEPYQIQGELQVQKDGSQALFTIKAKNEAAQALEITSQKTQTSFRKAKI